MTLLRRNLIIGASAAIAASLTWTFAAGPVVVELHPATVRGIVTLGSEPVARLAVRAIPPHGGSSDDTGTFFPPGTPAPYTAQTTVDGGDPGDPDDPGLEYLPSMVATFQFGATETSLSISRSTAITVDNTAASPSATVEVAFHYPVIQRVNASVTVIGGTLTEVGFSTNARDVDRNESSFASSRVRALTGPRTTLSTTMPVVPHPGVAVNATALVVNANGEASQWQLATQTVDVSQGGRSVTWTIDLTRNGILEGTIDVAAPPSLPVPLESYTVAYTGAVAGTVGISGLVQVSLDDPNYSVALPAGAYDLWTKANFAPLPDVNRYTMSMPTRVSVRAGATTIHDITEQLGIGRLPLRVEGLIDDSDIIEWFVAFQLPDLIGLPSLIGTGAVSPATGDLLELPLFPGTWQPSVTVLTLHNVSDPTLPLQEQFIKLVENDPAMPPTVVSPGSEVSLGQIAYTLVKTKVYLDVVELPGEAEVSIINPSIAASRRDFNPDSSVRADVIASSTVPTELSGQPVAGLTIMAEPGEYQLNASAMVRGRRTQFVGTTITFGEPVTTPAGANVDVVLTPSQNPDLQVSLKFPAITRPGVTTVVETPLGPAPPSGLQMACGEGACDPIFYDISTNAQFTGPVTVCVRRLMRDPAPGLASQLLLFHYNEHLPISQRWEQLLPPVNRPAAIDCGSGRADDLAACGCVDEASCGIDLASGLDVFLVCGMTTSFSPFAIFRGPVQLTNQVDGVTYTGPTGPPSLQSWTAPSTATYRITATGAQGANATSAPSLVGGCGAEIAGDFALQAGDVVQVLVGQKGTAAANNAGGGGGTFVVKNGQPLVIAGGGGGVRNTATVNGRSGTTQTAGSSGSSSAGYTTGFIPGGTNGLGGTRVVGLGAGGGGWSGNGAADGADGEGGFAFVGAKQGQGGLGKGCGVPAHGGYGGGGAGNGCFGAGGGGGYSGGGGGRIGGGGGSLNNGAHPANRENACTRTGHGLVSIVPVSQ